MPIKKENRKLYGTGWDAVRTSILVRAQNKCEWPGCGVANYAEGARPEQRKAEAGVEETEGERAAREACNNAWYSEREVHNMSADMGDMLWPSGFPKIIKIILTIAHLDHNPQNNDPENLMALCQLHHNRYDIEHRSASRKATYSNRRVLREEKRLADLGQQRFDIEPGEDPEPHLFHSPPELAITGDESDEEYQDKIDSLASYQVEEYAHSLDGEEEGDTP